MSGTTVPDENGEVRVGVPDGMDVASMAVLWPQMLEKVREQLGGTEEFVRVQPSQDGDGREIVYKKKEG